MKPLQGSIRPAVLWLTGLPASGKTTLADSVAEELKKLSLPIERLDGDRMRALFPGTGFSRKERNNHIQRAGYLASRLEQHGVFVVASFISPYRESRDFVRRLCRNFIEIYVSTPLSECEHRDSKGLYQRARRGEIQNFTGISDPYEPPLRPDLEINTQKLTVEQATALVLSTLEVPTGLSI